jgi:GT2 family glycosyltransferase
VSIERRPAVSVVIPTRGRTTRLVLTLSALALQRLDRELFEIIVVNDGPTPGPLQDVLRELGGEPVVEVVDSGARGVAQARNTGARAARGELLLFLDDDTVATPRLVERHLRQHAARDQVIHGAVTDLTAFKFTRDPSSPAQTLQGPQGRRLQRDQLAEIEGHADLLGPRRSFIERAAQQVAARRDHVHLRWLICIGTNTSMRRSLFERVGGFDPHYADLWGGEDLELGIRLAKAGAEFSLVEAPGYHLPLARDNVGADLTRFWRTVADRHDAPSLTHVASFLLGEITLDELADLAGFSTRTRSSHGPADQRANTRADP